MTLNYYAIGTALAGTMGTATPSATPPVGGTAIVTSTALPPNNLPSWPALLIELPHSAADIAAGNGFQDNQFEFDAYFVIGTSSGDDPRIRQTLLLWLGPLIESTYGAYQLGGLVDKAYVTSWRYEDYRYAGSVYPAWHLTVSVWKLGVPVTVTA